MPRHFSLLQDNFVCDCSEDKYIHLKYIQLNYYEYSLAVHKLSKFLDFDGVLESYLS